MTGDSNRSKFFAPRKKTSHRKGTILKVLRWLGLWLSLVVVPATNVAAQPTIVHSGLNCMRPGEFVVVLSGIDPGEDVETAKVYFRSSLYREFYYVEMTYQDGQYVGILPQPSEDTPKVIYYVEALDSAFNTARSREYEADIEGRCRQEPAAAYLPGGTAITVGATLGGAPAIPPGFTAAGIVGTIAATGIASGVGSGIGAGTAVVVGAAAAAAGGAGLAVLSAETDSATTTSVVAALPISSAVTTSIVPTGSTTSTGSGPNPPPTTIPGTPTTTVPGGSTTTPTTTPPTTTTPALDASCFTVAVLGTCRVRVDATCVALPVDRYEWTLDLNNRWRKVELSDGPASLEHTWANTDCVGDQSIRFRLKARRGGDTSTVHKNVVVPANLTVASKASIPVELRTQLAGSALLRGRVLLNETLVRTIDTSGPVEFSMRGRRGTNTLTGLVASTSGEPGTWRFELAGLTPGTLRIVSGNAVSLEPNAVVFQLSGSVGERVELTFVPRE